MLIHVISKQESSLQTLYLSGMRLSSANTEMLLTIIVESGACNTLQALIMERATNFDSHESVVKLADLLAISANLEECDFREQQGSREIKAEIEYASEGRTGYIII